MTRWLMIEGRRAPLVRTLPNCDIKALDSIIRSQPEHQSGWQLGYTNPHRRQAR